MKPYFLVEYAILDGVKVPIAGEVEDDSNYLSIIVGKNGAGKSRILLNIVSGITINSRLPVFEDDVVPEKYIFRIRNNSMNYNGPSHVIGASYIALGHKNEFWPKNSGNGYHEYKFINKTSPASVICVSNSFFHKFPSDETWPLDHRRLRRSESNIYKNLCLTEINVKSRQARSPINSMFFLQGLIKALVEDQYSLTNTLEMLHSFGEYDGVELSFHLFERLCVFELNEYNSSVEKFRDSLTFHEVFRSGGDDELRNIMDKIKLFLELTGYKENVRRIFPIDDLENPDDYNSYQGRFKHRTCVYKYSFYMNGKGDSSVISDEVRELMVFLNSYGLLIVTDIHFKKSSMSIPLKDLSSGELNILASLILINSEIKDCSVVLIDEPEINLHPKWQEEVIPTLMNCFSHVSGCHFIIATHSPLVASSVKEKNSSVIIIGEDKEKPLIVPGRTIKGRSSDFQLFYTLKYPGPHNEYLIRRLLTIIAKRKNGRDISHEDVLFINDVSDLLIDVEEGDKVKYLLAQAVALI
ncbi:AAA family ATPase [Klebsiella pneumoniae]|uniref:AAA family ATPase n=1 Tax=Klebsiella TaxID=570 RepID=UPI000E2DF067|nr:AAA family ATPase [Klebsiella pneumoniae]SWP90482.1 SMC domain-containing protein [Klebsiella pneumoniae]HBW9710360.1 AAA family ATPase [Klebsiella pneumoniae]HBX2462868.1 ATP-binding protein [Klebsiella pneumoniae]